MLLPFIYSVSWLKLKFLKLLAETEIGKLFRYEQNAVNYPNLIIFASEQHFESNYS